MTFPNCLQKGYGLLLIDFAYMIAKIENRVAGPEEPLSDLGEKTFMKYWKRRIIDVILERGTAHYGDPSAESHTNSNSNIRTKKNNMLFIDLREIVAETSIAIRHIMRASDEISFRVRRDNEIGISP